MATNTQVQTEIRELIPDALPALETFLRGASEASLFHTPEWHRVIRETYGHVCHYFVAWAGRQVVGVFPVVQVRSPLLGTKMIALPYQFHCGAPIAASETIQRELIARAIERSREVGAKFLEIRHGTPAPFLKEIGFVSVNSQLVVTSVPLVNLHEKQLRKGHREYTDYGLRRGVQISERNEVKDLLAFRALYLQENRQMGAPQAGKQYFLNLFTGMRSSLRLLLAHKDGVLLGGLLTLDDGRRIFARCGAYNSPVARKLHVANALFWRAMTDASKRGCHTFDLGISWAEDAGLIRYKEGWNGTTQPVFLHVYPLRANPPVPGSYFEGFGLAKAIWRRLPMPVVDWLGHQITRWVC